MSWFKVDDAFHSSKPVLKIPRKYRLAALGLWTSAGTWCAQEESDGFFPEWVLEELCGTAANARHLVASGLWIEVRSNLEGSSSVSGGSSSKSGESGWQFKNWSKYQPTREDLDEKREKDRVRQANYRKSQRDREATSDGLTEGQHHESNPPDPTRPDPTHIEEPLSEIPSGIPRPEVDGLLDLLDTCLEQNGFKKPTRTKKNSDAARLLLDKDGYDANQVAWMIRWATSDEFWRTNIMSMSKLREKFDQLKAKAGVGNQKAAAGFNGEIDVDAILGRDVWSPSTPPTGLSMAEEIEWKKQQRAEHKAERMEEAKRKLGVAA